MISKFLKTWWPGLSEPPEPESKPEPVTIRKVETDGPPPDVAADRLCQRGLHMPNRERKMFSRARENRYVSTRPRKNIEDRLREHYVDKALVQLARWNKRALVRRIKAQRVYQKLSNLADSPAKRQAIAYTELQAARLEMIHDVIDTILQWRGKVCQGQAIEPERVGLLRDPMTGRTFMWTENLDTTTPQGGRSAVRRTEFPRWVRIKTKTE